MADKQNPESTVHGDATDETTESAQTQGRSVQRQGEAMAPPQPSQAEGSRETIEEDLQEKGQAGR